MREITENSSCTILFSRYSIGTTCIFCGGQQRLQPAEALNDAAELLVDSDVLHPGRTVTHHTAAARPRPSTGPGKHTDSTELTENGRIASFKITFHQLVHHCHRIIIIIIILTKTTKSPSNGVNGTGSVEGNCTFMFKLCV